MRVVGEDVTVKEGADEEVDYDCFYQGPIVEVLGDGCLHCGTAHVPTDAGSLAQI